MAARGDDGAWTRRLARWQPLLLLILPAVWAAIVWSPSYSVDPDSYYHLGVARRMIEDGWLRQFPWLPHTTLHAPFPDVHLGQHVLLMPFVAVLPLQTALRVAVVAFASAMAASLYLVLRRHGVRWAAPWVVLGLATSPLALAYASFLKGAATFLIVLPWFVDAIWRGAHRRAFVLAWVSVYVYVGATVLVPFALVHLVVERWWHARWTWRPVVATVAGLAAGMIVNPLWPAHWGHVAAELRSIFARDPELIPGELRGGEWAMLTGEMLLGLAGVALVAWFVILVRQLGRAARVPAAAASGAIAALGLLGGALLAGSKLVELFVVFSILAVPIAAEAMRPWPRALVVAAIGLAIVVGARGGLRFHDEMAVPGQSHPRDYQVMAAWLDARTAPGEMVVAPWDDMPGLFLFGGDQRYLAGVNVQFLRDHDRTRFEAYGLLYRGAIGDPEAAMARLFDGARLLLVRRVPHLPGELPLTDHLAHSPHFEELASPTALWRVFRRLDDGAAPAAPAATTR